MRMGPQAEVLRWIFCAGHLPLPESKRLVNIQHDRQEAVHQAYQGV